MFMLFFPQMEGKKEKTILFQVGWKVYINKTSNSSFLIFILLIQIPD